MHLYMKHGKCNMTKFWDRNGGNNILAGWVGNLLHVMTGMLPTHSKYIQFHLD